ncbi:hypothetical protein LH496_27540, partial [Klebsiella pneumoniae]|uniref:tRNA methyl transferase PRC-barrel domain-containing protein n=1 Tax=Klebsiella pneumoniae TaxID=573 RepID=UPI002A4E2731
LFPLGDTPKAEVRREAAACGLLVADKPDSHDICFVADGDTGGLLAERLGPAGGGSGDAGSGEVLGRHEGSYRFTVGQRRGLRLGRPAADGRPRYVLDIEPVSGTVTVGPREALVIDRVTGSAARWCGPAPAGRVECTVQLRAHGASYRA